MSPVRTHPWSVPIRADTKVSLRNRTAERKGRQNACVTHFWSFKKNWLKEDAF